jgi:hypothetical protein
MKIVLYAKKCSFKYGDDCIARFIETPFYKNLNFTIHHQWTIFFLNFETQNHDNSSFDNSNSKSEERTLYTNRFNDT